MSSTAAGSPGKRPQPSQRESHERCVGLNVNQSDNFASVGDQRGNVTRIPEITGRPGWLPSAGVTNTASRAAESASNNSAQLSSFENGTSSATTYASAWPVESQPARLRTGRSPIGGDRTPSIESRCNVR